MAINGLERITDKILAEATAEAASILSAAEAETREISASYAARAEEIRRRLSEEAEREGKELVFRAKAAATNLGRDRMLRTESDLIDGVFDAAFEGLCRLEAEPATELLAGLLAAALTEELQAAETRVPEEDEAPVEAYEVILTPRDRERLGAAVLTAARKKLSGRVAEEKLDRLRLSERTVSAEGGLILVCGDTEINCTYSLLFAQLRAELEAEVSHTLFDQRGKN